MPVVLLLCSWQGCPASTPRKQEPTGGEGGPGSSSPLSGSRSWSPATWRGLGCSRRRPTHRPMADFVKALPARGALPGRRLGAFRRCRLEGGDATAPRRPAGGYLVADRRPWRYFVCRNGVAGGGLGVLPGVVRDLGGRLGDGRLRRLVRRGQSDPAFRASGRRRRSLLSRMSSWRQEVADLVSLARRLRPGLRRGPSGRGARRPNATRDPATENACAGKAAARVPSREAGGRSRGRVP